VVAEALGGSSYQRSGGLGVELLQVRVALAGVSLEAIVPLLAGPPVNAAFLSCELPLSFGGAHQ
jgi:hypothetical protein